MLSLIFAALLYWWPTHGFNSTMIWQMQLYPFYYKRRKKVKTKAKKTEGSFSQKRMIGIDFLNFHLLLPISRPWSSPCWHFTGIFNRNVLMWWLRLPLLRFHFWLCYLLSVLSSKSLYVSVSLFEIKGNNSTCVIGFVWELIYLICKLWYLINS